MHGARQLYSDHNKMYYSTQVFLPKWIQFTPARMDGDGIATKKKTTLAWVEK